ncbi:flagellar hook-length control protein FliK [Enterococcus saccharolyticus]|uniref:flagellar hook-length control protein FliK n=1 Tax=Enterococcus saccharolyticus TaxID=41997 RepID=UPI0039E0C32B
MERINQLTNSSLPTTNNQSSATDSSMFQMFFQHFQPSQEDTLQTEVGTAAQQSDLEQPTDEGSLSQPDSAKSFHQEQSFQSKKVPMKQVHSFSMNQTSLNTQSVNRPDVPVATSENNANATTTIDNHQQHSVHIHDRVQETSSSLNSNFEAVSTNKELRNQKNSQVIEHASFVSGDELPTPPIMDKPEKIMTNKQINAEMLMGTETIQPESNLLNKAPIDHQLTKHESVFDTESQSTLLVSEKNLENSEIDSLPGIETPSKKTFPSVPVVEETTQEAISKQKVITEKLPEEVLLGSKPSTESSSEQIIPPVPVNKNRIPTEQAIEKAVPEAVANQITEKLPEEVLLGSKPSTESPSEQIIPPVSVNKNRISTEQAIEKAVPEAVANQITEKLPEEALLGAKPKTESSSEQIIPPFSVNKNRIPTEQAIEKTVPEAVANQMTEKLPEEALLGAKPKTESYSEQMIEEQPTESNRHLLNPKTDTLDSKLEIVDELPTSLALDTVNLVTPEVVTVQQMKSNLDMFIGSDERTSIEAVTNLDTKNISIKPEEVFLNRVKPFVGEIMANSVLSKVAAERKQPTLTTEIASQVVMDSPEATLKPEVVLPSNDKALSNSPKNGTVPVEQLVETISANNADSLKTGSLVTDMNVQNVVTESESKPTKNVESSTGKMVSPAVTGSSESTMTQQAMLSIREAGTITIDLPKIQNGHAPTIEKVVQEMAKPIQQELQTMTRPNEKIVTFDLDPGNLGKIQVKMKVTPQAVSLELTVQSEQTKKMFEAVTTRLDKVLQKQENVSVFTVTRSEPTIASTTDNQSSFSQSFQQGFSQERSMQQQRHTTGRYRKPSLEENVIEQEVESRVSILA